MYEAKNYDHLLGLDGFSDKQLEAHFKLYQGYVNNTNTVISKVREYVDANEFGPEFSEIKRRFGWEFDGMRLHEYYFDNLTNDKAAREFDKDSEFAAKIKECYGSLENGHTELTATASMRGIGWAIMAYDKVADRIFTTWANEHDAGHLAGAVPLLVMDVFEHAYAFDYGTNRKEYIEAFYNATDWSKVKERFDAARK
ncbi:superoxide dismutase [Candidatus Nomurabacteria bacterium]|nr:superoxide dismutase [Candidatus Nomurabacteria bacterium]